MKLVFIVVALALGGCASKGDACVDFGGSCQPFGVCPNGSEQPTPAQLVAANPNANVAPYGCPNDTQLDASSGAVICCLPVPVTN